MRSEHAISRFSPSSTITDLKVMRKPIRYNPKHKCFENYIHCIGFCNIITQVYLCKENLFRVRQHLSPPLDMSERGSDWG